MTLIQKIFVNTLLRELQVHWSAELMLILVSRSKFYNQYVAYNWSFFKVCWIIEEAIFRLV